jgi:hypothetical protein
MSGSPEMGHAISFPDCQTLPDIARPCKDARRGHAGFEQALQDKANLAMKTLDQPIFEP